MQFALIVSTGNENRKKNWQVSTCTFDERKVMHR